jgi:hypothetical protein
MNQRGDRPAQDPKLPHTTRADLRDRAEIGPTSELLEDSDGTSKRRQRHRG